MSRIKDSKYIYAVSRIRTVENRLLKRNEIDRMIDAATAMEALRVLIETRYGYPGAENLEASDFENLLAEEQKKMYSLLKSIAPDPEVFELFMQPQYFHMVKVILKAEFAGIENFDDLLGRKGSTEAEKFKNLVSERTFSSMSGVMRSAIETALDDFHHTGDIKSVDFIIDKACFQQMREMADFFNHSFLKDYVASSADLRNMDIFLRLKHRSNIQETLKKVLVPGGYIPLETFFERNKDVEKALVIELLRTPYGVWAKDSVQAFINGGSLRWLEETYDHISLGFIKRAGTRISGLEPLVAYLLTKEREMGIVRRVMTGKLHGISGSRIRERLGKLYA